MGKQRTRPLTAEPSELDQRHEPWIDASELVRIALVALTVAGSWFHLWPRFGNLDVIATGATLIGGYPIFKEAFEAVTERRMTMELSMTIALVAALAIGEAFTALVITLFVLVAEVIEGLTVGRGRRAIRDLLDLLPGQVTVRDRDGQKEIGVSDLLLGDTIIVKPGGRIPVDGRVVGGVSFVDPSAVTGESLPVEKTVGTQVFAGTINQSGALEIQVTEIGSDTAFGQIIRAVEQAENRRAPIQKLADRLSGYLVYFALGSAALTFLLTHNPRSTISVVIVAGACGVAAGTPLAILGAIGQAARRGSIVKGGIYLEALSTVDTVVLDKTGTLTFGNPEVVEICPTSGSTAREVLESAAIAERLSEHPLGKAILKEAKVKGLSPCEPEEFEYVPGRGIRCQVEGREILVGNRALLAERTIPGMSGASGPAHLTEVFVSRAGRFLGRVLIADTLRPEAVKAVTELQALGLRTVLLSGDAR
ncbi:MAG: cation-translocating P-type ATPase, partial [Cyanobacteria bacterium REEB65]|nr:cation-translocating P-type ATPase [Cyanobacteria bacterium REEB65]